MPADPTPPSPMQPIRTIHFDPLGDFSPNRSATVFCNMDAPLPPRGYRRTLFALEGGAWAPGTGLPRPELTEADDPLPFAWARRGDVVISVGYSVHDPARPRAFKFDPENWTSPLFAQSRIVIDPTKLSRRCAELDLVNAIQHVRHYGIRGVDLLSARPGATAVFAKSAGSIAANFVWAWNRANVLAGDLRFRTSTKIGAYVGQAAVSGFRILKDSVVQPHLAGAAGTLPARIGDVDPATLAAASVTHYAKRVKALPPCLFFRGSPNGPAGPGPYDYDSYQGVLEQTEIHSSDHLRAIETLPGLDPRSQFHYGPVPKMEDVAIDFLDTVLDR